MSESTSETPRRSRLSSGVSHLNRQAARTGKAAVGTVLAAALISGLGSTPASAQQTTGDISAHSPEQTDGPAMDSGQGVLWEIPITSAISPTSITERLGGVAAELDEAVARGDVTLEQALAFFSQVQARVVAA